MSQANKWTKLEFNCCPFGNIQILVQQMAHKIIEFNYEIFPFNAFVSFSQKKDKRAVKTGSKAQFDSFN